MRIYKRLIEQFLKGSIWYISFIIAFYYTGITFSAGTNVKNTTPAVSGNIQQSRIQTVLTIPKLVSAGKLNKYTIIDPHWDKSQCGTCHNGSPTKANRKLHIRDVNKLCESCH
ncbi:MAG: cytochrome c3 family protein, partial [Thiohalomonadales bacterium]